MTVAELIAFLLLAEPEDQVALEIGDFAAPLITVEARYYRWTTGELTHEVVLTNQVREGS